jgi:amino acid permease
VYYYFIVIIIITILCLIKQNYIYIYTIYIYIIDTVHNYIYIHMILRCWYNIFTIRKQSLSTAAIFSDSAEGSEIEEPRATAPEAEANQFGLWQRKWLSQMLHGAGIFTNIYPNNHPVM